MRTNAPPDSMKGVSLARLLEGRSRAFDHKQRRDLLTARGPKVSPHLKARVSPIVQMDSSDYVRARACGAEENDGSFDYFAPCFSTLQSISSSSLWQCWCIGG